MKSQVAFKVCRLNCKSEAVSAVSDAMDYQVHYHWNQWVNPPSRGNQFLWVFASEAQAREFIRIEFGGQDAIYNGKIALYRVSARDVSTEASTIYGRVIKASDYYEGTLFAKSIRLVKKLA